MNGRVLGLLLGVAMVGGSAEAGAAEVWVGDFEVGDLSQWNFVLNGDVGGMAYASAQSQLVAEGMFAGRLELHNDAVWPNGLKRVELQHRPQDARTAEGATTWFAWSFYLPEALPEDPSQQIGYWESVNSYQQMMAFQVQGQDIAFYTRQPNNVEQWQASGVVTPEQWHRIAMGIHWSTDPGVGTVDVWFDGEQVVDQGPARTLADDNPHFVQVGLLRGAIEFDDVPVIIIDDAVEGDTLDDVRPDDLPGGGEDTGSSDGGMNTTGGPGDDTTGGETDTDTGGAVPSDEGCGCTTGPDQHRGAPWSVLTLFGLGALRRRRRR
ncbi:MAG: polysaccharide lyase [Myxococcales bacterium]|nr:polysaccharide lyase [Myxococcales bacterium]